MKTVPKKALPAVSGGVVPGPNGEGCTEKDLPPPEFPQSPMAPYGDPAPYDPILG